MADSSRHFFHNSANMSPSNHHRKTSSKLISIESTPDGDIQTVTATAEETTTNDSVKAFTHHLRDSWDDAVDGGGGGGTDTAVLD